MVFNACWPIFYLISASWAAAQTGLNFTFMFSLVRINMTVFATLFLKKINLRDFFCSKWFEICLKIVD